MDKPVWGRIEYTRDPVTFEWFHFCPDGLLVFGSLEESCDNCNRLRGIPNDS